MNKLLFVIFCFLVFTSTVVADTYVYDNLAPITNPKPWVNITFHEEDTPFIVQYYSLLRADKTTVVKNADGPVLDLIDSSYLPDRVSGPSTNEYGPIGDRFHFKINKFLNNGEYWLIVNGSQYNTHVKYNLGNSQQIEIKLIIDAESLKIWVANPRIELINPAESQSVAVGSQSPFNLVLATEYDVTCSIQQQPPPSSDDLADLYSNGKFLTSSFDGENYLHSITVADRASAGDSDLPLRGEFDYVNYLSLSDFLVICKQELLTEIILHPKILYIGYDTTPPNISLAEFSPSLLIDLNDLNTVMNITSQGDLISCSYRFTKQPRPEIFAKKFVSSLELITPLVENIHHFDDYFEKKFDLNSKHLDEYLPVSWVAGRNYEFDADVTCDNFAGRSSTKVISFDVNISNTLTFEVIHTDGNTLYDFANIKLYNYSSGNDIHFRTNLKSTCDYTTSLDNDLILIEKADDKPVRDHIFSLKKFPDDIKDAYNLQIKLVCSVSHLNSFDHSIYLAVDSSNPLPPVFERLESEENIENDFTCDGSISAILNAPNNEFITYPYGYGDNVKYIYSLFEQGISEPIVTAISDSFDKISVTLNKTSFASDLSLQYDTTYRWEVYTLDGSGKQSNTFSSMSIQRLQNTDRKCDTDSPSANISAILTPSGYEVVVGCIDEELNCATEFRFAKIPLGEDCQTASLEVLPLSTIFLFPEEARFCYQVFDTAIPVSHNSSIYFKDITPAVNIEFITPLSGVSPLKEFEFTIRTKSKDNRLLDCKHGPSSGRVESLLAAGEFSQVYGFTSFENFEERVGMNHSSHFDASSDIAGDLGQLFDASRESHIIDWVIACKESDVEVYPIRTFKLGFDTTAPVIIGEATPSLVQNPSNLNATLTFEVTDGAGHAEISYCEHTSDGGSSFESFIPTELEKFSTYVADFTKIINYPTNFVGDVVQNIYCSNLAGLVNQTNFNYRVEAKSEVDVDTNLDGYYSLGNIPFEISTPGLSSRCLISIDNGDLKSITRPDEGFALLGSTHAHDLALKDGTYAIHIECEDLWTKKSGFKNVNIIIDSIPPTISTIATTPTCSLDTISFTAVVDGTGSDLVNKTYKLKDWNGVELSSGTISDLDNPVSGLSLEVGKTLTVDLFVEDSAGYTNSEILTFEVATDEHMDCDKIAPTSTHSSLDVWGAVELNVFCDDHGGTNCADEFYYYFDDSGACTSTNSETFEIQSYNSLPLVVDFNSTLCYVVVDKKGNTAAIKSLSFDFFPSCYNGIRNANEDGVDCGGICPLKDCTICQNDVWDEQWEESMNCGYVCSNFCDDDGSIALTMEIFSPRNAVSSNKNFQFEIKTNRNVRCRFDEIGEFPKSDKLMYDLASPLQYFESSDYGLTHSVFVDGTSFSGNTRLNDYIKKILVVCKEFDTYTRFVVPYFGFDITPPNITVLAEPNLIDDPSFLDSLLMVTTDDLSVCDYSNRETVSSVNFDGDDYFIQDSYSTYREQHLNYWEEAAHIDGATDSLTDTQEITCTNMAGNTSYATYNIVIKPIHSQSITILNEGLSFTEQNGFIVLNVTTKIYASCEYKLAYQDEYTPMEMSNPLLGFSGEYSQATKHYANLNAVEEGTQKVEVVCKMFYNLFSDKATKLGNFVQDSVPPVFNSYINESTCSLDNLRIILAVDDETSDIVKLRYSVRVRDEEIRSFTDIDLNWVSPFQPLIDLIPYEGEIITVILEAVDSAGNVETLYDLNSRVTAFDDVICDSISPEINHTFNPVWGGFDLRVECFDEPGGSGCMDTYSYVTSLDSECDEFPELTLLNESNVFTESGTTCFSVQDRRPNYSPVLTETFTINPNCYNYKWDAGEDENGVDCGPACHISCDEITCENKIKDAFEEGVDCGGVCQTDYPPCQEVVCLDCDHLCSDNIQNNGEEGVDCGGICAACPPPPVVDFEIFLSSPEFGIAKTKEFTFEVLTSKPATCVQGFRGYSLTSDPHMLYDQLEETPFTTTGNMIHRVLMPSSVLDRGSDPVDLLENVQSWIVICESEGEYLPLELELGYDTTPPTINLTIVPNPIRSSMTFSAIISVESDDAVACTYLDKTGASIFFESDYGFENVNDISTYVELRSQEIFYHGPILTSYLQTISCRNIAQVGNSTSELINVTIEQEIDIEILTEEYQTTGNINLEIETMPEARCEYILNDAVPIDFSNSYSMNHITGITLLEGLNTVTVVCENLGSNFEGGNHINITLDSFAPIVTAEGPTYSCGLDSLRASFSVEDQTLIEEYNYTISYLDGVISSGVKNSKEFVESIGLTLGGTYIITATAVDKVGRDDSASIEIVASTSTHPDCDDDKPIANFSFRDVWGGVEVIVSCDDGDGIGCADRYDYYVADSCGQNLIGSPTGYLSENPLFVDDSGIFCLTVYDEASNPSVEVWKNISFFEYCYNDQEDPLEFGYNCEGVCSAPCNTCENDKQDLPFELGVDCDGVCPIDCDYVAPYVPFEIFLSSPRFGVSKTTDFTFEVVTSKPATCVQGFRGLSSTDDNSELFDGLQPFTTTGDMAHRVSLSSTSFPSGTDPSKNVNPWIVICEYEGEYASLKLDHVGYDTSPPVLSVSIIPNPVESPIAVFTDVLVNSDDDVVCTYLDKAGDSIYFENENPEDSQTYSRDHSSRIFYRGLLSTTYPQIISCRNIAQNTASYNETVIINIASGMDITVLTSQYHNTRDVNLELETFPEANCRYQISPYNDLQNNELIPFDETDSLVHSTSLNSYLVEGDNDVYIECANLGTGNISISYALITLDTLDPIINVESFTHSCNLGELRAHIFKTDNTSIEEFTYDLIYDREIIASETLYSNDIVEIRDLNPDGEYTFEVTAVDSAGNVGRGSTSIVASDIYHSSCDNIDPTGSINIQHVWGGAQATVICTDEDPSSGCLDLFDYYVADSCEQENPNYEQGRLSDLPLKFEDPGYICAVVFDKAINPSPEVVGELNILKHCYDYEQNYNEEGIDCGGSCEAKCGTCYNEIQDPFELGVNCGGVCHFIMDCGDTPPPIEDFVITLIDPLFGISDSREIDLAIHTTRDAVCTQGFFMDSPIPLTTRFNILNPFSVTGQQQHLVTISPNNEDSEWLHNDEYSMPWVVMCNDTSDGRLYLKPIPRFGFDTTLPSINFTFDPTQITDPHRMYTDLTIESNDLVVCNYLDYNDNMLFFDEQSIRDVNSYVSDMEVRIPYWQFPDGVHEQRIVCRNIAQAYDYRTENIVVQSDNTMVIVSNIKEFYNAEDYSHGSTIAVNLQVSTLVDANCDYTLSGDLQPFAQTGERIHSVVRNIPEGEHQLTVRCASRGSPASARFIQDFVVDFTSPEILISTAEESCSLSTIDFTVLAEDEVTGLDSFEYGLTDGISSLYNGSSTQQEVSLTVDLEENAPYHITVKAVDGAGNFGSNSVPFVATELSDSCDDVPPIGSASLEIKQDSVHVDIDCEDPWSGCTSHFGYAQSETTSCSDVTYELGYYSYTLPLKYFDSTNLCFVVYDLANNKDEKSVPININKQCFDGIQQANEDGIDCGGEFCERECYTCNNGLHDTYEDGIDCGGSCSPVECEGYGLLNINLINPIFGIANQKPFFLEVETNYDAVCRSGYDDGSRDNILDRYGGLQPFATSGEKHHATEIAINGDSHLSPFAKESLTSWTVICQANGEFVELKIPEFGFDTTPPIILDVVANPNPVIDPRTLRTELSVISDDPVVCTYINEWRESVFFPLESITNRETYEFVPRAILEYYGIENEYVDEQEIICRNLAQDYTEVHLLDILVKPENEITMDFILEDYYDTHEISLVVSTLQDTYCSYSTSRYGPSIEFEETGGTSHTRDVYLGEGEHTVEVICTSKNSDAVGVMSQILVVDTVKPTIELLMSENTCSLDTLFVSALVGGTGTLVDEYYYEIKQGVSIIQSDFISGPQLIIPLTDLVEGEVYDFTVVIYDQAGNNQNKTESFRVTDEDDDLCDLTAPELEVLEDPVWNGLEVTLICTDEQSGCAQQYGQFIAEDDCDEENYESYDYYEENPFLMTETSTACYRVYDKSGNFASGETSVELLPRCFNEQQDPDEDGIDCGGVCDARCNTCANNRQDLGEEGVDCGGICSSNVCPEVPEDVITLITPRLGISPTINFDLQAHTPSWSFCRHGSYDEDHAVESEEWFGELQEFASTGGTVHESNIVSSFIDGLHENDAESETPWVILCENNGHYFSKLFSLGYDTTDPYIELTAEPNPVVNPTNMKSVLGVISDDPIICTYLDEDGETVYFDQNSVDHVGSFGFQQTEMLSYWTRNNYVDEQTITCRNLAQRTAEEFINITVATTSSIDVNILNDAYTTKTTFFLEVSTDSPALCGYDLSGEGDFILFDQGESTTHTKLVTVNQGSHDVIITCSNDVGDAGYAHKKIIVDYTLPTVDILLSSKSCSLSEVSASLFLDGTFSEIDYYSYILLQNQETIIQGEGTNVELHIQTSLILNKNYELIVVAYDMAGNSREQSEEFTATDITNPSCDSIPPIGSAKTKLTWQGAETTIECSDFESGCSELFHYVYGEDVCENNEYISGERIIDNPLITTHPSTLCYKVYDNANNKFEGNTSIVVEPKCFNGFEDPDENGVDCEGPCIPECDICANGVEDLFEEGIDCGGVCDVSCDEQVSLEPFRIDLANPRFGVAQTKTFIFEVKTTQQASCRHGFLANARAPNRPAWYSQLSNFTYSNGKTHNVQIVAEHILQLKELQDASTTSWVVICKKNEEYLVKEIDMFGFDTTPAKISATAQPNPVVDPGNTISSIIVKSDDAVACTYVDEKGETVYFENVDINNPKTYGFDYSVTLDFWGLNDYTHNSKISCRNIAQASSEENIPINISLVDTVGISMDMDKYYNTDDVIISANTQQLATCRYRFSSEEDYSDFVLFQTYEHNILVHNLDEEEHTVEVNCISDSTGDNGTIYYDFIVDTKKPSAEISLSGNTCSLKKIAFDVLADGTGSDIDKFYYNVTYGGEIIVEKSTKDNEISISLDLDEGETYILDVIIYDEAGNSVHKHERLIATEFDAASCDTKPPEGRVILEPTWNGVSANIICTDKESSCLETFSYLFSPDGDCDHGLTTGRYDTDLPFKITKKTTLCYAVFDIANNKFEDSINIDYQPLCFNNVEDITEEGVDCGGTCLADCGTCTNKVKDAFEEGVDCGGVCETITKCSEIDALYGDDDESFLDEDEDGLPDDWEELYFGDLTQDGDGDFDEDGLTNLEEYTYNSNPTLADGDGDGLPDQWEINYFKSLSHGAADDPDQDGLSNIIEYTVGTDPTVRDVTDSDGDGLPDQWEDFYFHNLEEDAEGDPDEDGIFNLEEFSLGYSPLEKNSRGECELATDCQAGYTCNIDYTCVFIGTDDDALVAIQEGISLVGILLIILGVLFMGGGAGYIYYSREQLKTQREKISSVELAKRKAAMVAQQKIKNSKRLALIKKMNKAKNEAKKERTDERKRERDSLMGSFSSDKEKKSKQASNPKQEIKQEVVEKSTKSKKLDDGLEDDFVDVRDLGKGGKEKPIIKKGLIKETNKDVFDKLEKMSKKKSSHIENTTKKTTLKKSHSKNKK